MQTDTMNVNKLRQKYTCQIKINQNNKIKKYPEQNN